MDIFSISCFYFLCTYTQRRDWWVIWYFHLKFLRNLHTIIHCGYTHVHYPQECTRIPFSSHSYQHLFFLLFDDSPSNICEVISHCGFDLHFSDYKDFELLFVVHLSLFLGKRSLHFLCPFLIRLICCYCCCFAVVLFEFFVYVGYQPLIRHVAWKRFPIAKFVLLLLFMGSFAIYTEKKKKSFLVWCCPT